MKFRQISDIDLASVLASSEMHSEFGDGEAADLRQVDLRGKDLSDTTLTEIAFDQADLGEADLRRINLAYSGMNDANLSGANVLGANMYCVDLRGANLEGLLGWRGAFWVVANLHNVRNAPHGFVEWAISEAGAVSLEDDKRWTESITDQWLGRPYRHIR
jgi:hypothetical protein